MVHPVIYAVTIGVALGAALFAYFAVNQAHHSHAPRYPRYPEFIDKRKSDKPGTSNGSRRPSSQSEFEEDVCAICLNTQKGEEIMLPCEHKFHMKCITKWKNECPSCRRAF